MAEFDVQTIKKRMLRKYPTFGSTISSVKYEIVGDDHPVQTAATNGNTIYCNKNYLSKLSEDEQLFVFSHEVCHIALNHIARSKGKEPHLWNIATDAVINKHLEKDGLPILEGAVNIDDALKYDAEELYEKLIKEQEEKKQSNCNCGKPQQNLQGSGNQGGQSNQNGQNGQGGSSSQQEQGSQGEKNSQGSGGQCGNGNQNAGNGGQQEQVGHDSHEMWEDAVKEANGANSEDKDKNKDKQKEKEKKSSASSDENNPKEDEYKLREDDKKNKGDDKNNSLDKTLGKIVSEKEIFKQNEEEIIKRAEEIMKGLSNSRGFGGEGVSDRSMGDVGKAGKSVVNWKKILRQYLEIEDEAWGHRFSDRGNGYAARIEDVEYEEQAEVEIILDTSGSISPQLLRAFLRQVKTICKDSTLRVGAFSDIFYGFTEVKKMSDIDSLVLRGGGGTNFDAASRAFTKRKDVNKICFTDGQDCGNAGIREKRSDIIWITFDNPNFKPDNGKVIYVPQSEIYKYMTKENDREL